MIEIAATSCHILTLNTPKMNQIRFRLGLRFRPRRVNLLRSHRFKGPISKEKNDRKKGQGRENENGE